MSHYLHFGKRTTGRPPVADLTAEDLRQIQAEYLQTNHSKKEGSVQLAWVRFCEANAERFGHLVADHMPATTIPTAVREACRKRKAIIGAARGGAARQRHEGAYVPGTMRRHSEMSRRLWAGERASVDDATRNVACWIPWPWGGCPCSDKFGVRLGRWQTLIVHDDATSFVPFVSSVFRWHQSYRATDAASVIYRAERDVVQFDHWAIEGGVWQAKRTLAVLGGRFISAKGRPNQKLVENYIGRLWGIMAGQAGDVGRHQAEIKRNSDLYVQARKGSVDPRKHFLSLTQGQEALYAAMDYLAEKRIKSATYGTWVPKERWEMDLLEAPRQPRSAEDDFLILPVAKTHVVRRGMVKTTEEGPLSMPMEWSFAADWLWEYEGRKVTIYFDPLAEWPVKATLTLKDSRKPIGQIECINSWGESKDRAAEMVRSIRQTMMTETRVLATKATERTLRHGTGVIVSTSNGQPASPAVADASQPAIERPASIEIPLRDAVATPARATDRDLAKSLSRRAALARESSLHS
ncbi:hypothetical protein JIN85_17090 [Luteolibacter pohnpeiensis]|uniref:Uncharacterized protein n=1 Tax=Luteolibacter pohnpeiensis TaxID=454153 RepID=A0A934SE01_9BACT|nr:hypothetical protein [Luteolibacter pohnpeiensis]MBK1884139.1 hypothetical protein [Luteolibacter pohnpeiensis]